MSELGEPEHGPVEAIPWPKQLTARAVQPGPAPRLMGYDVYADLAKHYGFADMVALSLTGELPAPAVSHALQTAMLFLSPCAVSEAPSHAAAIARVCGAQPAGVLQTGAIALAEQAAFWVREHEPLLQWLRDPSPPYPQACMAQSGNDQAAVEQLRDVLGAFAAQVPALEHNPTLVAAALSVLYACGLREAHQWVSLLLIARLPSVAAEAFAATPGDFRGYPMDVPHFAYEEEHGRTRR